jgi:hypothetical protein
MLVLDQVRFPHHCRRVPKSSRSGQFQGNGVLRPVVHAPISVQVLTNGRSLVSMHESGVYDRSFRRQLPQLRRIL